MAASSPPQIIPWPLVLRLYHGHTVAEVGAHVAGPGLPEDLGGLPSGETNDGDASRHTGLPRTVTEGKVSYGGGEV